MFSYSYKIKEINMKRKIVSLVIAAAILITSICIGSSHDSTMVAGAGNGDNYSVESMENLASVFDFIRGRNEVVQNSEESINFSTNAIEPLNFSKTKDRSNEHTSVTVEFQTNVSAHSTSSNAKYTGGVSELKQSLSRSLILYITEDHTLYETSGTTTLYQRSIDSDGYATTTNTYMKWDMKIFCEEDDAYILMNELIFISDNESHHLKAQNKNKWIKATFDMIDNLVDIDYENREVLSALGEMLDILIKYDYISPGEESVSLTQNDFVDILEQENEPTDSWEKLDLTFDIDISSPNVPYMSSTAITKENKENKILTGYSYSGFQAIPEYVTVWTTKDNKVNQEISIRNIDNTMINFNGDVSIELENTEDFEKLFINKESDAE